MHKQSENSNKEKNTKKYKWNNSELNSTVTTEKFKRAIEDEIK